MLLGSNVLLCNNLLYLCCLFSCAGSCTSQFSPLGEAGLSLMLAGQTVTALGPSGYLIQGCRERQREASSRSLDSLARRKAVNYRLPSMTEVSMCSLKSLFCVYVCNMQGLSLICRPMAGSHSFRTKVGTGHASH